MVRLILTVVLTFIVLPVLSLLVQKKTSDACHDIKKGRLQERLKPLLKWRVWLTFFAATSIWSLVALAFWFLPTKFPTASSSKKQVVYLHNFFARWQVSPMELSLCYASTLVYFLLAARCRAYSLDAELRKQREESCPGGNHCANLDEPVLRFNRKCIPNLDGKGLAPLAPSLPYQGITTRIYSSAFGNALGSLVDRDDGASWRKKVLDACTEGRIDISKLPRVFLVCAYSPEEVIRETFLRLFAEGDAGLKCTESARALKDAFGGDVEAAMRGEWARETNEGTTQVSQIAECAKELFEHFEKVDRMYQGLVKAIGHIGRENPTLRAELEAYRVEAVVRILLVPKGVSLWEHCGRKTIAAQRARQGMRCFASIVGEAPCYIGRIDGIERSHREDMGIQQIPLPFTDFALLLPDGDSGRLEVWDFYDESHLLVTYGRRKACRTSVAPVSMYEVFRHHWVAYHTTENGGYTALEEVMDGGRRYWT